MRRNRYLFILMISILIITACAQTEDLNEAEKLDESNHGQETSVSSEESNDEEVSSTSVESERVSEDDRAEPEMKTDTGTYQGQIDSNFVEIKISGVPIEKEFKVFMLSDELKESFEMLDFDRDIEVRFEYFENEKGQSVIIFIEKIANESSSTQNFVV